MIKLVTARWHLPIHDEVERQALALQSVLWHGGLVRAAGVNDLVIAAAAIVHGAVVVHYDVDFEHIAKVSELRQEWVVRGPGQLDAPPGQCGSRCLHAEPIKHCTSSGKMLSLALRS